MKIDWKNITPERFEELSFRIIESEGFTEVKWFGKGGGDKGRDIIAKLTTNYSKNIRKTETWIIQCKRYSIKPPNKNDISSFLQQCREHKPDNVLLIISTTISSDMKDWLNAISSDYKFKIHYWEELDLLKLVKTKSKELRDYFPEVYDNISIRSDSPILFTEMNEGQRYYLCDEIEEVGFFILNDYGDEQNAVFISEFIDFIRNNEIKFTKSEKNKN